MHWEIGSGYRKVRSIKVGGRKIIPSAKTAGTGSVGRMQAQFLRRNVSFDSIGEKLGIVKDLKNCFPESYKQILSLAYYLIMEDRNPLSRFPKWAATHLHPFGANIPSQRAANSSPPSLRMPGKTSSCSKGKDGSKKNIWLMIRPPYPLIPRPSNKMERGHNKDHDPLPQINLALLFGEESGLPVYYRKLPGNIADVKTIQKLLADIDFLQLEK